MLKSVVKIFETIEIDGVETTQFTDTYSIIGPDNLECFAPADNDRFQGELAEFLAAGGTIVEKDIYAEPMH